MKIELKSINANKESVFAQIKDILGVEPKLDHDTFIFEVNNPIQWGKIKTMVDMFSTNHETLIILPIN
jgi:hypothetical protein